MFNLKKTTLALLAFSSSAAFAGTMGPVCVPGNVTVPCEATAWDFGGYALYLNQTNNSNLAYLGTNLNSNGFTNYINRDDNWGWGFKLEGSYHYGMGSDVNLNWYHYNNNSNQDYTTSVISQPGLLEFQAPSSTALNAKTQWDAANIEFGQHIDFNQVSNIRLHAGAQFAHLKTSLSGFSGQRSGSFTLANNSTLTYNGFGPRAGADLAYRLGHGFSVYGNSGAALLVGSNKFSKNAGLIATPTSFYSVGGSTTAVVPELEGKLGAMYTHAMASGDLTLDAGYMWVNYFGANSTPLSGSSIAATPSNNVGYSDFALNGVYFGLKWVGNIA